MDERHLLSAVLGFPIILALSVPFGLLGYYMPQLLQTRLVGFWAAHPRFATSAPVAGLLTAMGTYIIVFSTLSALRHMALGTHAFDLGVYDQVLWNSSHGRLFEFSLAEHPIVENTLSYLGFHFSPGLLLLVPLYWIISDVRALLFVQTVAIALVAVPIYLLAAKTLGSRMAALGLSVAYLLSPAIGYINLFDFHSVAIAMPFIAFAIYFMIQRSYAWWAIMIGLAMSFKEDIAVVAVAMGLYIALEQKRWLIGSAGALISVSWLYLVIEKVIPLFRGDSYFYFGQYSYLGNNLSQVASSLLLNPLRLVAIMTDPARIEFAFHLLVPQGLLPILGPAPLLVTLPVFVYLFASTDPHKYSIIFHYSAPIVALMFAASVDGIKRLDTYLSRSNDARGKGRPVLFAIVCFVLAASAFSYYLHGRGPMAKGYDPSSFRPVPSSSVVFRIISRIPADATVSIHRDIVPQLTHRRYIYLFPDIHDAEYLVLWEGAEGEPYADTLPAWKKEVGEALADRRYEVLLREEGFILMRKRITRAQVIEEKVESDTINPIL